MGIEPGNHDLSLAGTMSTTSGTTATELNRTVKRDHLKTLLIIVIEVILPLFCQWGPQLNLLLQKIKTNNFHF